MKKFISFVGLTTILITTPQVLSADKPSWADEKKEINKYHKEEREELREQHKKEKEELKEYHKSQKEDMKEKHKSDKKALKDSKKAEREAMIKERQERIKKQRENGDRYEAQDEE